MFFYQYQVSMFVECQLLWWTMLSVSIKHNTPLTKHFTNGFGKKMQMFTTTTIF